MRHRKLPNYSKNPEWFRILKDDSAIVGKDMCQLFDLTNQQLSLLVKDKYLPKHDFERVSRGQLQKFWNIGTIRKFVKELNGEKE